MSTKLDLGQLQAQNQRGRLVLVPADYPGPCKDTPIASVFSSFGLDRQKAYVQLFAAAPDLLAACERLLHMNEDWIANSSPSVPYNDWSDAIFAAREAIAKAKGVTDP